MRRTEFLKYLTRVLFFVEVTPTLYSFFYRRDERSGRHFIIVDLLDNSIYLESFEDRVTISTDLTKENITNILKAIKPSKNENYTK